VVFRYKICGGEGAIINLREANDRPRPLKTKFSWLEVTGTDLYKISVGCDIPMEFQDDHGAVGR